MASNNIKVICRCASNTRRSWQRKVLKRICRFRPPNAIEQREGSEIVVAFSDDLSTVQLKSAQLSSGPERDGFKFDRVFPMGTKQHEVFDYGVKE